MHFFKPFNSRVSSLPCALHGIWTAELIVGQICGASRGEKVVGSCSGVRDVCLGAAVEAVGQAATDQAATRCDSALI